MFVVTPGGITATGVPDPPVAAVPLMGGRVLVEVTVPPAVAPDAVPWTLFPLLLVLVKVVMP
jgi:hypothetical protein